MFNILLSLLVVSCAASDLNFKKSLFKSKVTKCETSSYPFPKSQKVPGYVKVNLDESPLTRWSQVVSPRKYQIMDAFQVIISIVQRFPLGNKLIDFVDKKFPELASTLPEPLRSELVGIANLTGIPIGRMGLYNLFYEFFTVCTSILARDSRGQLLHARNLDFGVFLGWDLKNHTWLLTEKLRPLAVNVEFVRGGRTLYYSTQLAGYLGLLTALKPGAYSLTVNERFSLDGGFIGIIEWMRGMRQQQWNAVVTRAAFEQDESYLQAKTRLMSSKLLAPVYLILGGAQPNEGCVITRSRAKALDVWQLGSEPTHAWYLLQTNNDHWQKPPFFDDRVHPGEFCMNQLGQQAVASSGLFNVLSTRPVLNKLTLYSVVMSVANGTLESYIQYCPDPCSLW